MTGDHPVNLAAVLDKHPLKDCPVPALQFIAKHKLLRLKVQLDRSYLGLRAQTASGDLQYECNKQQQKVHQTFSFQCAGRWPALLHTGELLAIELLGSLSKLLASTSLTFVYL